VDIIADIYDKKQPNDIFVLDNGHASLAHYVVLEKHGFCDAEEMIKKHGIHSSRDVEHGVLVSNGSLGQAATVALGMAFADAKRTVYLVTSDGACMEGCVYETLRLQRPNLEIHITWNGWGAYQRIYPWQLDVHDDPRDNIIVHYVGEHYPSWLQGLDGHYLTLTKDQRAELMV
jgi:hypothetical protein